VFCVLHCFLLPGYSCADAIYSAITHVLLLLLLLPPPLLLVLQDRSAVFAGTFGALAIMTLISVALGQVSQ
jgi:hypothetical protein